MALGPNTPLRDIFIRSGVEDTSRAGANTLAVKAGGGFATSTAVSRARTAVTPLRAAWSPRWTRSACVRANGTGRGCCRSCRFGGRGHCFGRGRRRCRFT